MTDLHTDLIAFYRVYAAEARRAAASSPEAIARLDRIDAAISLEKQTSGATPEEEGELWGKLWNWLQERGLIESDGEYNADDFIERLTDHEEQMSISVGRAWQPETFDTLERLAERMPDLRGHYARATGGINADSVIALLGGQLDAALVAEPSHG